MGSQTAVTRLSAIALRAISGPMPAGSPAVIPILGSGIYLQLPQPPSPHDPQPPPGPQPVGFPQPPSSPQPPPLMPLAFGNSYRRQHFRRPHSPDSRDGFKLRSCCLAFLMDTGSKVFSQGVQHRGRPQEP